MNEETNVFKGADFGHMFQTRDGSRAVYLCELEYFLNADGEPKVHILYIEHVGSMRYYADGKNLSGVSTDDIVGRWKDDDDTKSTVTITGADAAHIDNVLAKCLRYINNKRKSDYDCISGAIAEAILKIEKREETKIKSIKDGIKGIRKMLEL